MLPQCFPVLLTRPAAQNARFAAMLSGPIVLSPLSEVRFLPVDLPSADCVVFTSETAVMAMRGRLPAPRAWCVGDRTAAAARDAGFDAQSAAGDADALVGAIIAAGDRGPMVHLRGRAARGDVAARLTAAGIPCTELVVYEMRPLPPTDAALALLAGKGPVVVPLFSPAAAVRFASVPATAPLLLACLSSAVAAAAPPAAAIRIAARPDAQAMVAAMQSLETWGKQG